MFGVIVRRSLSLQRGAFTYLVFFLVLVLSCRGQELIGPSQPIVALVGEDVTLPCHLKPSSDAFDLTVEWTRPDLDPKFIFVRRDGGEFELRKHPLFRGRTQMFPDELKHGNVSLKLSKVQLSDEAEYRCFIPSLSKAVTLQLLVVPNNPITTHDPPGSHAVIGYAGVAVMTIAAVIFAVMWEKRQIRPIVTENRTDHEDRTEGERTPERDLSVFQDENKEEEEERKPLIAEREEESVSITPTEGERHQGQGSEQKLGSKDEDEKQKGLELGETGQLQNLLRDQEREEKEIKRDKEHEEKWFSVVRRSFTKSLSEEPDSELLQNFQPVMTELQMKVPKK